MTNETDNISAIKTTIATLHAKTWEICGKHYSLKDITIADADKLKSLINLSSANYENIQVSLTPQNLVTVLNILLDTSDITTDIPDAIAADIITNFFYSKLLNATLTNLSLPFSPQLKMNTTQNQK